ncbi:VOC family protein [bacterium RCC_150]
MLRVRPVQLTSDVDGWKQLLEVLGLVCVQDDGDRLEFDAASGRLALHRVPAGSPTDGTTVFGVEVGDLAEFVRRTLADGTAAELVDTDHGQAVRITAGDGFTFLADKAANRETSVEAAAGLAVVGTWLTPDVPRAARDMRNIGARAVDMSPKAAGVTAAGVTAADFRAKNGGILAVRQAPNTATGSLTFEYDGDIAALQVRLAKAGIKAALAAPVLTVPSPGGSIRVASSTNPE